MLELENTPIPNPDILSRVVDDEAVLVLPIKGKVKVLNEVGAVIWQLIDGQRNIQQISSEICEQFEGKQEAIEIDTLRFVAELKEREIVTIK
jgi:hypothetical protein